MSFDDERIIEIFAAHTGRTEEIVRWDEISAWSRGMVAEWLPDAIVFLTTTVPLYEANINAKASGLDALLGELERRRVPRISLESIREQAVWRQREKVDEVIDRRFSPDERSAVRAAFASNREFASPYVQLAALTLADCNLERVRVAVRGVNDWVEYLAAAANKGYDSL